jgi:hypothetical protein
VTSETTVLVEKQTQILFILNGHNALDNWNVVVKALHYKSIGPGIDPWWFH